MGGQCGALADQKARPVRVDHTVPGHHLHGPHCRSYSGERRGQGDGAKRLGCKGAGTLVKGGQGGVTQMPDGSRLWNGARVGSLGNSGELTGGAEGKLNGIALVG